MDRDEIYLNQFIWDKNKNKAATNKKKHHVSFELAVRIFNDPALFVVYNEENSTDEDGELYIGICDNLCTVLTVSAKERDDYIRIISARKATKKEVDIYEKNRKKL